MVIGQRHIEKTDHAQGICREHPVSSGISLPLPLRTKNTVVKLIGVGQGYSRPRASDVGFPELQHRFADAITIEVIANHWPVTGPSHRLQMYDAAIGAPVLKMNEP